MASSTSRSVSHAVYLMTIAMLAIALAGHGDGQRALAQTATGPERVPRLISYQGMLRNPEGRAYNGSYTLTFRIYEGLADEVAAAAWQEIHEEVAVRDGAFSVLLGAVEPFPGSLFDDPDDYIGVQVEGFDEMQPRQRFAAVPYAMSAAYAANAARAESAALADQATRADFANNAGRAQEALRLVPPSSNGAQAIMTGDGVLAVDGNGKNLLLRTNGGAVDIESTTSPLFLRSRGDVVINPSGEDGGVVLGNGDPINVQGPLRIWGDWPVIIKRFKDVGNGAHFFTGVPADTFHCVAAGWSARFDIRESETGDFMIWTYVRDGQWVARATFSTQDEHENPDIDILCFRTEIATFEGDRFLNEPN